MNTKTPEEPKTYPPLSELIREHIAITKDEVPVLIEFMDYAQHMEQQLGFGKLAMGMRRSENAKLRALVQGMLDLSDHDSECHSREFVGASCNCMKKVIDARAKEAGFVPTNTQDNG